MQEQVPKKTLIWGEGMMYFPIYVPILNLRRFRKPKRHGRNLDPHIDPRVPIQLDCIQLPRNGRLEDLTMYSLLNMIVWVVATQIFFIFTPKIGEMIQFD